MFDIKGKWLLLGTVTCTKAGGHCTHRDGTDADISRFHADGTSVNRKKLEGVVVETFKGGAGEKVGPKRPFLLFESDGRMHIYLE